MKSRPTVSFIVPVFDDRSTVARCLQAILDQDAPGNLEIIVVDNGSTDNFQEVMPVDGRIILISESKRGAAAARNAGLRRAASPYLAFVDADVILEPNWLSVGLKRLDAPWLDCFQSAVVPKSACPEDDYMLGLREAFIRFKTGGRFDYLNPVAISLPTVNSSAFVIKQAARQGRLMFFDETLLRCEDLDLSYRAQFQGLHIATSVETSASVYDDRNFHQYLIRSFWNGFYSRRVRTRYGGPSFAWPALSRQLFAQVELSQFQFFFVVLNQLCSLLGELGSFLISLVWRRTADLMTTPTRLPVRRNELFLKVTLPSTSEIYVLSPSIRITDFASSANLFCFRSGRRHVIEAAAYGELVQILRRSCASMRPIDIGTPGEKALVETLTRLEILIPATSFDSVKPQS